MPFPNFDPVLVHLGPIASRWYALAYVAGILLGWRYIAGLVKAERLWARRGPIATTLQIDDLILWITLGVIVGGRLGRLERGDFGAKGGDLRLQHFELIASDKVHLGDQPVGLGAEGGLGFVARRLGQSHGGVGQLGHFVEERVLGLHLFYMARRGMKAKGLSSKPHQQ